MNLKAGVLAVLCLALLLLALPAAADNIVVNGDFSAGPTEGSGAGWTVNQNVYGYSMWGFVFIGDHGDPNISDALNGCEGELCIDGSGVWLGSLSQILPTNAGDSYTLSFLYNAGSGSPNELQVLFGGTVAEDLVNLDSDTFATYTISGLTATSSSTELEFLGREDTSDLALTEVSVTDDGPIVTPEPSSLYLLGSGLVGLLSLARRKIMA